LIDGEISEISTSGMNFLGQQQQPIRDLE